MRSFRILFGLICLIACFILDPVQRLFSESPELKIFKAKVVAVADGDTITVKADTKEMKIRLYGIDCPENGQAFTIEATKFTSSLALNQVVTIKPHETDDYGRTVADVIFSDGKNLNHEIVRNGYAWWFRKYAPNDRTLKQLEEEAKTAKRGLWADPNATPPWLYRKSTSSQLTIPGRLSQGTAREAMRIGK